MRHSSMLTGVFVALSLMLVICVISVQLRRRDSNASITESSGQVLIEARNKHLEIETGWNVSKRDWQIALCNNSEQSIYIKELRISCGCVKVVNYPPKIDSGQCEPVNLLVDLQHLIRSPQLSYELTESWTLLALTDSPSGASQKMRLSAALSVPIRFTDEEISFWGERAFVIGSKESRSIVASVRTPVNEFTAESTLGLGKVWVKPQAERSYRIHYQPTGKLYPGLLKDKVKLQIRTGSNSEATEIFVDVQGELVNGVKATPSTIVFLPRQAKTTANLTLESRSGERISIFSDNKRYAKQGFQIQTLSNSGFSLQQELSVNFTAAQIDKDIEFLRIYFRYEGSNQTESIDIPVNLVTAG